ncbi:MAG: HYR domain-containing protein [Acidobacteriota bacterium]
MQKRDRIALALAVCLFSVVSAWAQTDTVYFSITPSQFYVYQAEVFLTVRGATLGTESTVVTYTNGDTVIAVEPQVNPGQSVLTDVWVPAGVTSEPGQWAVRVIATDVGGEQRISGPVYLNVVERPQTDPPQLSMPEVVVFEATSANGANATYDAGGAGCSPSSGSFFPMGSTTVTCSASNSFGTTTGSFVLIVTDTTVPVLSGVPADIATTNPVVTFTTPTAVDNINGALSVTCAPASGSTFPEGETDVQCTAIDAHSNYGVATFKVTILVTPVLHLPGNISAEATSAAGAAVSYTATADGGPIACSPLSGSVFPLGTTTVGCSATNDAGTTTGSFTVTVVDTTPPALTVPGNMTKEATGPSGAAVTFTATATDLGANVTPVCTPASGSTFALGATTVQCTATDSHSNQSSGSFTVTVVDTTPPALSLPANITVEATAANGAAVTFSATATDLVDGSVTPACTAASGSTFALGTTTVNCTATDSRSNQSSGSFTVTVRDTTPPNLTVPADKTVEATSASGAVVTYTTSATDLVDGNVTPVCAPASGSTFPLGTTTVQCSATDAHGNHSNKSFLVTVRDTTAPVILGIDGTPREVLWPNNHKMQTTTVIVVATDNVDASPHARIISVTSDQPVNDGGDGDTSPDWLITGDLTVQLRSERTSGVDRHYTITVEVTDFSGNVTLGTLVVEVRPGG